MFGPLLVSFFRIQTNRRIEYLSRMAEVSNSAQCFAPTPDIAELQSPFSSWQVGSNTGIEDTASRAYIFWLDIRAST
jgi:hypothetical protein